MYVYTIVTKISLENGFFPDSVSRWLADLLAGWRQQPLAGWLAGWLAATLEESPVMTLVSEVEDEME
jgi:hypothetical protein